jgi:hypothetical protein
MSTKDEALKLALEALENSKEVFAKIQEHGIRSGASAAQMRLGEVLIYDRAITAIQQALAAPVQEPAGEVIAVPMGLSGDDVQIRTHFYQEIPPVGTKVWATPPAAQPAPVQGPVAMTFERLSRGMEILAWNRSQANPPIEITKEQWVANELERFYTTPPAQPAVPEEIMHWDGDDGEDGPHNDIASLLNNMLCNRDLEVGEKIHITRATRLPDVWVRVTKIPEDADVEYEVITAAAPKKGQP